MDDERMNYWLKIDAILYSKLTELQRLNIERENLIAEAEYQSELSPLLLEKMDINLAKYKQLSNEISALKQTIKKNYFIKKGGFE